MTAKEFAKNNSDILLRRLTRDEFEELTDGCVVFVVVVSRGNKPSEERTVINAGYNMVANTHSVNGKTTEVITICATAGGTVKADCITLWDASDEGSHILYKCVPLSAGDPRTGKKWVYK